MSQNHLKEYILLISSRLVQCHGKIQTATWYDRLVPGNKACDDNDKHQGIFILGHFPTIELAQEGHQIIAMKWSFS